MALILQLKLLQSNLDESMKVLTEKEERSELDEQQLSLYNELKELSNTDATTDEQIAKLNLLGTKITEIETKLNEEYKQLCEQAQSLLPSK